MAQADLERTQKQYENSCKEETEFFERYLKGLAFAFSVVPVLIGGTVAGILQVKSAPSSLFLLVGPLMTAIAAYIGLKSTGRLYAAWLERVTVRAKFEQMLELTKPIKRTDGYWLDEPLIASRHLRDRAKFKSSEEFVESNKDLGYHKSARQLFFASIWVSAVLSLGIVLLAWKCWPLGDAAILK